MRLLAVLFLGLYSLALGSSSLLAEDHSACQGAQWTTSSSGTIFNGDIIRYSFASSVKSLIIEKQQAIRDAAMYARSEWNGNSCKDNNDYPHITVASLGASYGPGVKHTTAGRGILDVKVGWDEGSGPFGACAEYNPAFNWITLYRYAGGDNCALGVLFDRIDQGNNSGRGHLALDVGALFAHEAGHAFGLRHTTVQDKCIMGPERSRNPIGFPRHRHKLYKKVTCEEARDLDKIANSLTELVDECAANPTKCHNNGPGSDGGIVPFDIDLDPSLPGQNPADIDDLDGIVTSEDGIICVSIPVFPYLICYKCTYYVPGKGCIR